MALRKNNSIMALTTQGERHTAGGNPENATWCMELCD